MPSRPFDSPWPEKTPSIEPLLLPPRRSSKRRRTRDDSHASTSKMARQVVVDAQEVEQALTDCEIYSSNAVISCFPNADTVVAQGEWISFVWNSRRPSLTQQNLVDIFLFHGDSQQQILHIANHSNPTDQAGRINAHVNDTWWGDRATDWNGQNISYPYYWVLIPSGTTIDSNAIAQPTFTAVQTTYADFVIASMSSASAASASAASVASVASVSRSLASAESAASASRSLTTIPSSSSTASLQANASSKEFPHWAIAVIVVLGLLAILATCVLIFLIMRRMRRRQEYESNRNSMGSSSPMMANAGGPSSPLLASGFVPAPESIGHEGATREAGSVIHDGASTMSRTGSAGNNEAPFSGEDAAIMADAFRKMLRKPDFAARPTEEGESPDGPNAEGSESILGRELAEEGRDIRSVRSERGVRVETLSDGDDTVQDGH